MKTSLLPVKRPPAETVSSKTENFTLSLESAEAVWLLLTFTQWAFQRVEVEHGFVIEPTRLNLTTFADQLTPSELRWLVVDVLRSNEGERTLRSEHLGNLTTDNAGEAPRDETVQRIEQRADAFARAHGLQASERVPLANATSLDQTTERLRTRFLLCADATRST
jgi:hypothetical protein